jgi:hypothetical protein
MSMVPKILLMVWTVMAAHASASNLAKSLDLEVGDIKEIDLENALDVTLSRKGIIHAIHIGQGKWQILALKSGAVLLESSSHSLLITVSTKRTRLKNEQPSSLCEIPGISCISWPLVKGDLDDHRLWRAAYAACREDDSCIFAVQLSDVARIQRQSWVRSIIGERWTVETLVDGRIIVSGPCHAEARSFLRQAFTEDLNLGLLSHRCPAPEIGPHWQLKAWLILKSKLVGDRQGIDVKPLAEASLQSNLHLNVTPEIFRLQLQTMSEKREGQTLAAPTITISNGQDSLTQNGGEFRTDRRGSNGELESAWHQHGLRLQVKADALGQEDVLLSYHATIKSRSDLAHELSLAEFKNALVIKPGHVTFAGSVNLDTDLSMEDQRFSEIPIIGPLLRRSGRMDNSQKVELWLELHRYGSDFKPQPPAELPP